MRNILKRLTLCFLGILFAVLLSELLLRIGGLVYLRARLRSMKEIKNADSAINIICAGDSFTVGLGAERGESYPEQLDRILKAEDINIHAPYNMNIPGYTLSLIIGNFEKYQTEYAPDMLMVLGGMNDFHLLEGSLYFHSQFPENLFSRMRIHKFYWWIRKSYYIKTMKKPDIDEFFGQMPEITDTKIDRKAKNRYSSYLEEAKKKRDLGLYDEAVKLQRLALKINPNDSLAMGELGHTLIHGLDAYRDGIEMLEKAFLMSKDPEEYEYFMSLVYAYHYTGQISKALGVLRICVWYDPNNIRDFGEFIIRQKMPPIKYKAKHLSALRYNVSELIRLCNNSGIKLVLQTYPNGGSMINELVREVSKRNNVILVDHEYIFNSLADRSEYFAPDWHCNKKGYGLMANNIRAEIISWINEKRTQN